MCFILMCIYNCCVYTPLSISILPPSNASGFCCHTVIANPTFAPTPLITQDDCNGCNIHAGRQDDCNGVLLMQAGTMIAMVVMHMQAGRMIECTCRQA